MIEQIWNKKLVVVIELSQDDITDQSNPLPLIINFVWNSYVGSYYDTISEFFQMYAPFPLRKQQFYLTVEPSGQKLQPTEIVYHIVEKYEISLGQPIVLKWHFRSKQEYQQIDLRRHFKNNLKSSTALKYGKMGASILTVQMSINNVQSMINAFMNNDYNKFLGSANVQSDDLGHTFLNQRSQKIAVRFIQKDITIERFVSKQTIFAQFLQSTFGEQLAQKLNFRIHLVPIQDLKIDMAKLEKYCHPDGYLYIHI